MNITKWLKWIWAESVTDNIVVLSTTSPEPLPLEWSSQGYDYRPIKADDVDQIYRSFPRIDPQNIAKRIAHNDYGTLALKGNDVVGFCWASTKPRKLEGEKPLQYTISPKPGHGYLYDANVKRSERGNSVGTNVIDGVLRQLHHKNIFQTFYTHNAHYDPMARITKTLGFKKQGTLRYERWLCFWNRDISDLSSYSIN